MQNKRNNCYLNDIYLHEFLQVFLSFNDNYIERLGRVKYKAVTKIKQKQKQTERTTIKTNKKCIPHRVHILSES